MDIFAFVRHYLQILVWFLFLFLLRCFTSESYLALIRNSYIRKVSSREIVNFLYLIPFKDNIDAYRIFLRPFIYFMSRYPSDAFTFYLIFYFNL